METKKNIYVTKLHSKYEMGWKHGYTIAKNREEARKNLESKFPEDFVEVGARVMAMVPSVIDNYKIRFIKLK